MTTMTKTQSVTPLRAKEPEARFIDLCAAEWIKIRSLRSTYLVLLFAAAVTIFINLNGVHSDLYYLDHPRTPPTPLPPGWQPWVYDPLSRSLSKISIQFMVLGAAAIGGLTMFGEYSTGLIRVTFAAVPARRGVVAAKIVVMTALSTVLGIVVALVSFLGGQAMLSSRHVGTSLSVPDAFWAVVAYTVVVPVCALIGMMFGAVIRNATATIVAVVAFLFLLPAFFGGDKYRWVKETGKLFPLNAEGHLTEWSKSPYNDGKWPQTTTESWLVLGAWAIVSIIVAVTVVKRRDV